MREIVIDTETTGLDPLSGHRVVEIGAVELVDHAPTGRTFHCCRQADRASDHLRQVRTLGPVSG
jgi:DNA polymerase III subunit epsilon